ARGALYCWIDSRCGDGKSQTHEHASPALHDRLAIRIGRGIMPERGACEFPHIATSGSIASRLSSSTACRTAGLTPARSAIVTPSCVHGPQSSLDGRSRRNCPRELTLEKSHLARGLASIMSRI